MLIEIVSLIFLLIGFYIIWENYLENPKAPPGPLKLPILGSLLQLSLADSRHYIGVDKLSKKYGKLMNLKMGSMPAVFISDYNIMKQIYTMEEANDRTCVGVLLDRQFRNPNIGFIGSRGHVWEETRKVSVEGLKPYGFGNRRVLEGRLEFEFESFCTKLEKQRNLSQDSTVYFTRELFDPIVMNLILTMLIGERMGHNSEIVQELILANETFISNGVIGAGLLTAFPFLGKLFPKTLGVDKQLKGIAMFHAHTRKLVEMRKEEGLYKTNPVCFTDEFLRKMENSSQFTIEAFQMIFMDLLQAGFETTSNSMNFATLLIGSHPEVQEQLVAEIKEVCGDRRPTLLTKLPYAQAVATEVYRWARIAVFGALRTAASDIRYDKYFIPKGTMLTPNFHSIFFDEEFWGDPYSFRPGRFMDEKKTLIKSKMDVVATFGMGKRNCFGEIIARDTLYYTLTNLFNKYKLSVPEGSPMPNLEPKMGITFGPHPYTLKVELRN